ncbi:unnamed protein product [Linum trigynum]|uniref:Hyaluronan/mRNA-binding protein domain-containing protein n=1 Tax=Linum trigynum TaxID=586398 RepID=A0AAV2D0M6_9ROSI
MQKLMTLKEYEKLQLQKKEALKSGEARQVRVDEDLESMQLVEKKREEETDVSKKKKEEAEKKKKANYQYQDRRNYSNGERFDNQSMAGRGRGRGNYQNQPWRANYGDDKVFNGRRGNDGGDGAAAVTAGDVSAAGGGAKGGPEFAIDPKQFPELFREK